MFFTVFLHGPSAYVSEEMIFSADSRSERHDGCSEQTNDHLFPKDPDERYKSYSKYKLAFSLLISAIYFLLRVFELCGKRVSAFKS